MKIRKYRESFMSLAQSQVKCLKSKSHNKSQKSKLISQNQWIVFYATSRMKRMNL